MAHHLLLVRHGETAASRAGRFSGATDLPLTEAGCRQAAALAPLVRKMAPECCLTSPMHRTCQTAEILSSSLNLTITPDADLREIDFGRWEGRTFQEIAEADPQLVAKWAAWEDDFGFPGGEKLADFRERIRKCGERLLDLDRETVLAVTHGGVIRLLLCYLLNLPARHYLLFEVQPGTMARVEIFDRKGVLSGLNLRG